MNGFLLYTLKSALALGLFALVYRVVFMKDTYFVMRRFYLLAALLLSLVLPATGLHFNAISLTFPADYPERGNHLQ